MRRDSDDRLLVLTYVLEYPGIGLVKIGQAKYYVDRLRQLIGASPIPPRVVCVFVGAHHERDLHARFARLRKHGEFFADTPELRAYLASDAMAEHRLTHDEARSMSPRLLRSRERAKDVELGASLETNE